MFRLGIISEIGEGENLGYARVSFDENEIVSGWLAIPSMATYKTKHWIPVEVNAQVLCSMDENCEQGAIVLVLWSDTDTPPDWAGPDTMGVKYAEGAEVFYGEGDSGIMYNDPDIGIEWPFELIGGKENLIISEKDLHLMSFADYKKL